MQDLFKGYYRPTKEQFKEIWKSAFFVFDTNILLNLYRWPETANRDFWKVLDKVSNRIWLPHQVALEYQKNRLTVIADQKNKYSDVINIFNENFNNLSKKINEINLRKRHSEINPDSKLEAIKAIIDEYQKELEGQQDKFSKIYHDKDSIRTKIEKHFNNKVGKPLTSTQLDSLYKGSQDNYANGKPPGFRDIKKGESEVYYSGGTKIIAKYGDVIVWHQILEEFKDKDNVNSLIFVTDDGKDDWWWKEKFGAKKTIGPRPELVEDMQSIAHVENFYMYNSDIFLKYAKEFLELDVQEASIKSVKDLQEASKADNIFNNATIRNNEIDKILTSFDQLQTPLSNSNSSESNNNYDYTDNSKVKFISQKVYTDAKAEVLKLKPNNVYDLQFIRNNLNYKLQAEYPTFIEEYGQSTFKKGIEAAIAIAYSEYLANT